VIIYVNQEVRLARLIAFAATAVKRAHSRTDAYRNALLKGFAYCACLSCGCYDVRFMSASACRCQLGERTPSTKNKPLFFLSGRQKTPGILRRCKKVCVDIVTRCSVFGSPSKGLQHSHHRYYPHTQYRPPPVSRAKPQTKTLSFVTDLAPELGLRHPELGSDAG
jgi:hypothetical protein